MTSQKTLRAIIRYHRRGLTVDQISLLLPFTPRIEIAYTIAHQQRSQHDQHHPTQPGV
ncbi:hypothetical protein [Bifidobacterium sp. UTCIF-39]|uniref:hypothetical protein n=1 Tax=Bifidobacterium sp. UTCIF-39 TaxID=1465359 RepID=UPI0015E338AE|nr:hypothetical protein [Bifidobacterium sp. UTCIF-39]